MRRGIVSCVFLLSLNLSFTALGISWDFEVTSPTIPAGWSGFGWRTDQGKLTNVVPGSPDNNLAQYRLPVLE